MVEDILAADEPLKSFLAAVYAQTDAVGAAQASMYAVGESLGMARPDAQRAAEDLIGMGLVEVRTLSGGIGLSGEGLAACLQMAGPGTGAAHAGAGLGSGPIVSDTDRTAIERILGQLKYLAGDKSWVFDALTDLMADLKTIDAQLMSSRPKTAIIRECLRSVQGLLDSAGHKDVAGDVGRLLGD
ncbi:MAG: hypothetical protein ABIL58_15040 [Pseudomonadota bacterium]